MIIDMSDWLTAERKAPTAEGAAAETKEGEPAPPKVQPKAELEPLRPYDACQHKRMKIDDVQRTVKCGDCKMWLDPVWCLRELFRYYEQRVDFRLAAIEEFEKREREKRERRDERKKKPREARAMSMAQHLQRAAWNEYQAKTLAVRASVQRALAGRIEQELLEEAAGQPEATAEPVQAQSRPREE